MGHSLGMPALWFYRGGPTALQPLLLFALAIGLVHVVLGLLLGVWTAARGHHRRQLASKAGTLLVLAGLFGLAGVTAAGFPALMLTPAVAALVVGVVVACVSQGALGLLLGPLDLLGALGNVLSYLRLAAVGLASTYLAEVANQLGARGPLLLGLLVATLFHALNLALAAFSPTIQALRLHYVEFFGQFYEGGGRLFAPLGGSVAQSPESERITASPSPPPTRPSRSRPGHLSERTNIMELGLIALAAGLAVGLSALATGYAQARIGAAAMGAVAEKPELTGRAILLVAIPETLVILGFAVAAMIILLLGGK